MKASYLAIDTALDEQRRRIGFDFILDRLDLSGSVLKPLSERQFASYISDYRLVCFVD